MKSRPGQGLTVISKKIRLKQNDHASRRTQRSPHTRREQHRTKATPRQPLRPAQRKNPTFVGWGFWLLELAKESLTITYFHTGIRTIIGVESFHGPVRDGKGWYQLAMVIRHKGGAVALVGTTTNLVKK